MGVRDFIKNDVLDPAFCTIANGSLSDAGFEPAFDSENDLVVKKNGVKITFNQRIEDYAWVEVELFNPNFTLFVPQIEGRKDQLGLAPQNEFLNISAYAGMLVTARISDIDSLDQIVINAAGMSVTDVLVIRAIRVVQNNAALDEISNRAVFDVVGGAIAGFSYNADTNAYEGLINTGTITNFSLTAVLGEGDYAVMEIETDGVAAFTLAVDGAVHSSAAKNIKIYWPKNLQNTWPNAVQMLIANFPANVSIKLRYGTFQTADYTAFGGSAQSGFIQPSVIPPTSDILNSDNTWNGLNYFNGGIKVNGTVGHFLSISLGGVIAGIALGTMALQNANAVAITGGSAAGLTSVASAQFTGENYSSGTANPMNFSMNAAKQFEINGPAVAVNFVSAQGAITANPPKLQAAGTDANVGIQILSKGTGTVDLITAGTGAIQAITNGSVTQFQITHTASATRFLQVTGSNGVDPTLSASGGRVRISSNTRIDVADSATPQLLVNGTTRGLRVICGSFGAAIEGVDQTGIASYQPMTVGGSLIDFTTSGVKQFGITHTAGATNYVQVTGSNGGNPSVSASGGLLNLASAMQWTNQTVGTTVGAAGGASALPATPLGYVTISLNAIGNVKIPYYNT